MKDFSLNAKWKVHVKPFVQTFVSSILRLGIEPAVFRTAGFFTSRAWSLLGYGF
jgi:hypothetical protein